MKAWGGALRWVCAAERGDATCAWARALFAEARRGREHGAGHCGGFARLSVAMRCAWARALFAEARRGREHGAGHCGGFARLSVAMQLARAREGHLRLSINRIRSPSLKLLM